MNATNPLPSVRISTGIEGLDHILGGGLPPNRLYLVEGSPGTGKTTLALQFLLAGIRLGEPGLCITLSETQEELREVAQSHGWPFDDLSIFDLAIPEKGVRSDRQYTLFHPSEVELGETTKTILREVERVQPRRVILDSVSELRLLASDPLRYRRELRGLKRFFDERRCTLLLLDDQPETSDQQLQSVAHGVIRLEHGSPGYGGPAASAC
jgi:circadian clock protein KaiC